MKKSEGSLKRWDMDFELLSLIDLLTTIIDNRGKTCPTADSGIPLIATNCIHNDRLYPSYEKIRFVSQQTYTEWFRGHPKPGDIIFVNKGTPGSCCWVPDPVDFCIAQDMVALRVDEKKVYPKFLFALLRSNEVQNLIANMHVGTLIPHFKKGDFDKLLLKIPLNRKFQEFVGDLYFDISKRIDLNQRMNETLEGLARTLFKSWFVDFDPVKAKAEGRKPEGMDDATAALFPSTFTECILGPIPEGWEISSLGDFIELAYGKALKANGRNEGLVPVYGSNGQIGWHDTALVKGPGIVVGRKGNPGTVIYVHEDFFPIDTTFFVIPSQRIPSIIFLRMLMERLGLPNFSADSAVPGLNRNAAYSVKCILPPLNLIENFNSLITPFILKKENLKNENKLLTDIRELLLPRFISGKLRLCEISETVETLAS